MTEKNKAHLYPPKLLGVLFVYLFILHTFSVTKLLAQDETFGWQASFFGPGVPGSVFALGEYQNDLIIGGNFETGLDQVFNGVARWDGKMLFPLVDSDSAGVDGTVYSVVVFQGKLIVGGDFSSAGGVAVNGIASWNGQSWSAFEGLSLNGPQTVVRAMATYNGDLYISGRFSGANSISTSNIVRWDGVMAHPLGPSDNQGVNGQINALLVHENLLIVGGSFSREGAPLQQSIAAWNGTTWQAMRTNQNEGIAGTVYALENFNGDLAVGGDFFQNGGLDFHRVGIWDGVGWSDLSGCCTSSSDEVRALLSFDNRLYAGGDFLFPEGSEGQSFERWNGFVWERVNPVGGPSDVDPVQVLFEYSNEIVVGTRNTSPEGRSRVNGVVRWDGNSWLQLDGTGATGVMPYVRSFARFGGELYIGGQFETAGTQIVNGVARQSEDGWLPLNAPNPGVGPLLGANSVFDISVINDQLFVVGRFSEAGGQPADSVASWNGKEWTSYPDIEGTFFGGSVSVAIEYEGDLIIGGNFFSAGGSEANNVARWDGENWQPLLGPEGNGTNGEVATMAIYEGDLIVGGGFSSAGGATARRLARWDGEQWSEFNGGVSGFAQSVFDLYVDGQDLYVGGRFDSAGGVAADNIARWDGEQWLPLGGGIGFIQVLSIHGFDRDIYAAGRFFSAGGISVQNIARWDGAAWSTLEGPSGNGIPAINVYDLTDDSGMILAGGWFSEAGGIPSQSLASFRFEPSSVIILERQPPISEIDETVVVVSRVSGIKRAPQSGTVTITASSGESCSTQQLLNPESSEAEYSCELELGTSGDIQLTAAFSASSTHSDSVSNSTIHRVRSPSSTQIVQLLPESAQVSGQPVEIRAIVDVMPSATGHIQILEGDDLLCTIVLPDISCIFLNSGIGPKLITAAYQGDDTYSSSQDTTNYEATPTSLSFTPNPLDLGEIGIGGTSPVSLIEITNVSDQTLTLNALGPVSLPFALSDEGDCGDFPRKLSNGASCTLGFSVSPLDDETLRTILTLESNAVDGPHRFFLEALGLDKVFQDEFLESVD